MPLNLYKPSTSAMPLRMEASVRSHKVKTPVCDSAFFREKHNPSVILPADVNMVAESLERRNHSWFVSTNVTSDLMVQVGRDVFHLHKLPMVSGSGYLNRLVFNRSCGSADRKIRIKNFPGGSETFELVVKFCYGMQIDLRPTNIAPLYCAAHFLEMTNDLQQDNLIYKAEAFLSFLLLSSWKDTFQILKSCESILSWARELHILKRCSEAVAWKACADPNTLEFVNNDIECLIPGNEGTSSPKSPVETWWFEDVSNLRIDNFIEVIVSIKKKGMRPDLVGSCIANWTSNFLSRAKTELGNPAQGGLTMEVTRVTVESLIRVLPKEEKSVSCNFLLQLLKTGLNLKIDAKLIDNLLRRTALMLESCRAKDLLVENYDINDMVYDVGIVAKVVQAYVSLAPSSPASRISNVGRLVDEYLTLVARIRNLPAKDFQSLVEALPEYARLCDDNLYRAIDMYLKAHPGLTEEERSGICRTMEYHKLSQEARKHATKNDRLPMNMSTRFTLLEQVSMTRSITSVGSNYQRTKSQAILRVSKGLGRGWMSSQRDIKMMKQEVEAMKVQLSDLCSCRMEIQRQVKRGIM